MAKTIAADAALRPARSISAPAAATVSALAGITSSIVFQWEFDSWEPDHLHWVAPSSFTIYEDGQWFFFAKHISNQRRSGGIFDTGDNWEWQLQMTYLGGNDVVLHAPLLKLRVLEYKEKIDDFSTRGEDTIFAQRFREFASATAGRLIV